jgi:hypothetical protein
MSQEVSAQRTDGDEVMTKAKDGQTFSKFSKEALEIEIGAASGELSHPEEG